MNMTTTPWAFWLLLEQSNGGLYSLPWHPLHKELVSPWHLLMSKTRRKQNCAAGALKHTWHRSDAAAVASHLHRAHCMKTWYHHQIQKYIAYYNAVRAVLIDMHRKFGEVRTSGSWDGCRWADRHIHTHNTQPFYGSVEFVRENTGEPVPEETFTHYSHRSHQSSLSAFSI